MTSVRIAALLLAVCVGIACAPTTAAAQKPASADVSEWVHIDGQKNPELIPEWSAWRTAFRRLGNGPADPKNGRRLIPLELQEVLSNEEALLLLKEGDAELQRFEECGRQTDKLTQRLIRGEDQELIRRENDELEMECRWQTLHARDRVVAALGDASRLALRRWVEKLKAGTSVSVPKKDINRFKLPQ